MAKSPVKSSSQVTDDSTFLSSSQNKSSEKQQSDIAGSRPQSRRTILKDRSSSCKRVTQKRKSSKTSEAESTSTEKDLKPFWNEACQEKSSHLWLPTKTVLQDLDLTSSDRLSKETAEKSWFSTKFHCLPNKNSQTTYVPLFMSSAADSTACESTKIVSRKIRIYPDVKQREILNKWFGVSRYVFNQTVDLLKDGTVKANWKEVKTGLIRNLPEWTKSVPYQIKSIAIRDCCQAVSRCKQKAKQTGKFHSVSYRSRKSSKQGIFVPKTAISSNGVYYTLLGVLKAAEPIQTDTDSRLVKENGRWFLIVSKKQQVIHSENQARPVALDPGVRTFVSFYSLDCCGKIGCQDFGRIQRLCFHLDNLLSRIAKADKRSRHNMRKYAVRLCVTC